MSQTFPPQSRKFKEFERCRRWFRRVDDFDPEPADCIGYDTLRNIRRFLGRDLSSDPPSESLVVAVHGACHGNGTPFASGAYAVFFGESSSYNECAPLPEQERQTSNSGPLYAAKRALEIIEDKIMGNEGEPRIKQVIIMTHSTYLHDGLSDFVWQWEENNYLNYDEQTVANRFPIEKLHHMMKEAQAEKRFSTALWLVRKEYNEDAISLAHRVYSQSLSKSKQREYLSDPFQRCMLYWMHTAPNNDDAQQLCRRLKITMHDQVSGGFTSFAAPLRRLVVTGEDREQNFERLFGPTSMSIMHRQHLRVRLQVVPESSLPRGPLESLLDEGAPWHRPRKPTKYELSILMRRKRRCGL